MYQLFKNNNNFNSDISFWDTASVTTMFEMFLNANAFNRPLEMDTSSVTIPLPWNSNSFKTTHQ